MNIVISYRSINISYLVVLFNFDNSNYNTLKLVKSLLMSVSNQPSGISV